MNDLRYSSGHAGCAAGDMLMFVVNKTAWHPLGRRIGSFAAGVYNSWSRGRVALTSPDMMAEPEVRFNLLSDDRDFDRMIDAVGRMCTLLAAPEMRAARNEAFLPNGPLVRSLNRPIARNRMTSALISMLLATSGRLRRHLLRGAIIDPAALADDPAALRRLVIDRAVPMGHAAGTCRIGRGDDILAVLDPGCRVRGVAGLRVIDGSVMPSMVCANTNIPIIMIAEHAAAKILAA